MFGGESGILWEAMSYAGEKIVLLRRECHILEREVLLWARKYNIWGRKLLLCGRNVLFGGEEGIVGRKYHISGAKMYIVFPMCTQVFYLLCSLEGMAGNGNVTLEPTQQTDISLFGCIKNHLNDIRMCAPLLCCVIAALRSGVGMTWQGEGVSLPVRNCRRNVCILRIDV